MGFDSDLMFFSWDVMELIILCYKSLPPFILNYIKHPPMNHGGCRGFFITDSGPCDWFCFSP